MRQRKLQKNGDGDSQRRWRRGIRLAEAATQWQKWQQQVWNSDGETAEAGKVEAILTVAARASLGRGGRRRDEGGKAAAKTAATDEAAVTELVQDVLGRNGNEVAKMVAARLEQQR